MSTYLTSLATDKFLASTSDNEQMPGGGSLARDVVSTPQPPIGVHMLRANCFGELRIRVVSDPGPRTPDPGGHGGGWRGVAWRVACRGDLSLMPYGNCLGPGAP